VKRAERPDVRLSGKALRQELYQRRVRQEEKHEYPVGAVQRKWPPVHGEIQGGERPHPNDGKGGDCQVVIGRELDHRSDQRERAEDAGDEDKEP